jgi:hypothetical protein
LTVEARFNVKLLLGFEVFIPVTDTGLPFTKTVNIAAVG